jgi:phosphatidylserine/phosphatidylglycerophosphate/cardiolipin synthase-like enzyme
MRRKHQDEITLRNMVVRVATETNLPWRPVLKLATEKRVPIRILIFNLPGLRWLAEQFPHLSMQNVWIIADDEFRAKAEALAQAYRQLKIAVHPKMHSKVALAAPDRVYVSSANLGSMGQHETIVELSSSILHDWWLTTIWQPLWNESLEMTE